MTATYYQVEKPSCVDKKVKVITSNRKVWLESSLVDIKAGD